MFAVIQGADGMLGMEVVGSGYPDGINLASRAQVFYRGEGLKVGELLERSRADVGHGNEVKIRTGSEAGQQITSPGAHAGKA